MKQFKAIFWDNDGTLVNTEPLYVEAIQQIFDEIGYEGNAEELYLRYTISQGRHVWDPVAEALNLSEEQIEELREKRDRNYEKLIAQKVHILDGVEKTLSTLHKKFPMALVTCAQGKHVKTIHEQTGFFQYFDFIIAHEDFEHTKPHPDPYLRAAQKMGVDPADCLVIEDSERGVNSAKSAGMTCFAIPVDLSHKGDFSRADRVLKNAKEILNILHISPEKN